MDIIPESGHGLRMNTRENSELTIPIVTSVKALFLYILFFNYGFINPFSYELPFLPFISIFDRIPSAIYQVLSVILGFAVIMPLLIKRYYSAFAFTSGLITLFFILSSKILFSNSLTFAACFLLLAGLYYGSIYIFRIQISILYVGAAINKIFSEDWWNGLFIDYLLKDMLQGSLYQLLFPAGEMNTAIVLGIIVMLIELLLGIFVLIPKFTRFVIVGGLLFHGSMLVVTAGSLSIFFMYIMSAAFISISDFRPHQITLQGGHAITIYILTRLDLTDTIVAGYEIKKKRFTIDKLGYQFSGRKAWLELIQSRQFAVWAWFMILIGWFLIPRIVQKVIQFM